MLIFTNLSCKIFLSLCIQGFPLHISIHLVYLPEFFYCFMSLNKSSTAIIKILQVKIYTSKGLGRFIVIKKSLKQIRIATSIIKFVEF